MPWIQSMRFKKGWERYCFCEWLLFRLVQWPKPINSTIYYFVYMFDAILCIVCGWNAMEWWWLFLHLRKSKCVRCPTYGFEFYHIIQMVNLNQINALSDTVSNMVCFSQFWKHKKSCLLNRIFAFCERLCSVTPTN